MKRSVFISVLSLLGLQLLGNLSSGYTYLTNITPCDTLFVNQKPNSNAKLSVRDKFRFKDQNILSPLQSKHQEFPVASITNSVILLSEALTINLASRYLSYRIKTNKYKPFLINQFNNDIKVPP